MRASSSSSSHKSLSVYNFDAEEEAVEAASQKYAVRINSRLSCQKSDSVVAKKEAITKYHFLQSFTTDLHLKQRDVTGVLCIDLPETDNDTRSYAIDLPDQNLTPNDEKVELDVAVTSCVHDQMGTKRHEDGLLVQMDSLDVENSAALITSDIAVDGFSGNEGSWASLSGSPTTTASDIEKTEGCRQHPCSKNICSVSQDTYHSDVEVVVVPDYVIYGSTVYGESQLAFFSDGLKVDCLDALGNDENLVAEWSSADIIHIRCWWSGIVDAALVELLLKSAEANADTVEAVRMRFSVNDLQWLEKQRKIKNLSPRYKDVWDNHSSDDLLWEDDDVVGFMSFSREYFLEIEEPFDDVIYPRGDPDAVSISKRDIELLQPETFINDTIIDFYIKYLKNKIEESEKHRFHFFNSFFFRKLADLDKDRFHDSEGRAAFLRVRKWTRKVNIFEKDYIFIPINFNLHWSLLVICHPGEIAKFEVDDMKESPKVPCILHMDSIRGSHSGLKNIIQSYIWEEWKERHPESVELDSSKFSNIRFVELELPQQENSFDCGLFLLHYAELFLEQAPMDFNPFRLMKYSNFLNVDWFPPAEASYKRMLIRKLIYDLLNDSSQKIGSTPVGDGYLETSGYQEHDDSRSLVGLLPKQWSPGKHAMRDTVCSDTTVRGMEPSPTSVTNEYDKQSTPILKEFMEPAKILGSEKKANASQPASCRVVDHEDNKGELIIAQCTLLPAVDETFGASVCSMTKKDSDEIFLIVPQDVNCAVQSKKPDFSPEDCGFVPDSPESSYYHGEGTMKIDTTETEQRDHGCADIFTIQVGNHHGTSCNHPTPEKSKSSGDKDHETPIELACEKDDELQHQVACTGKVAISCSQEISSVEANEGDPDCQEIQVDPSQDVVLTGCYVSYADDVQLIDVRLVDQQPSKRRRLALSDGHRIRTRSCSRESHPDT